MSQGPSGRADEALILRRAPVGGGAVDRRAAGVERVGRRRAAVVPERGETGVDALEIAHRAESAGHVLGEVVVPGEVPLDAALGPGVSRHQDRVEPGRSVDAYSRSRRRPTCSR